MANEDSKSFESSTKCWICDNNFVKGDVTVRDHCHISIEKTEALQTEITISTPVYTANFLPCFAI